MSAVIFDCRSMFSLKLGKNMARLSNEERAEALEQYPDEIRVQVERVVRLMQRRKRKDDSGSTE